jgi:branched-chain amino acid transport system permease protein
MIALILAGLILVFFSSAYASGMGDAGAALNSATSRLVGIRVGRMLAFGWGLAAAIGVMTGMMAAIRAWSPSTAPVCKSNP